MEIDGSSTVALVSEAVAEEYIDKQGPKLQIPIIEMGLALDDL